MGVSERHRQALERLGIARNMRPGGLWGRLMIVLIPPIIIILVISGYISYRISYEFIDIALERTTRLQARAMVHEIEGFLGKCRRDVLFLTGSWDRIAGSEDFLAKNRGAGGISYSSLAYIAQNQGLVFYTVTGSDSIEQIPKDLFARIRPSPLLLLEPLLTLKPGDVWISPVTEIEHPVPDRSTRFRQAQERVIQFATPHVSQDNRIIGFFILTVDARQVRNILSVYNSPRSPILTYSRSPEVRYVYLFDKEGWILFQSEDPQSPKMELSSYLARSGLDGTLGRPGLPNAFRPSSRYGFFWKMVTQVKEGRFDVIKPKDSWDLPLVQKEHYLAYCPIRFQRSPAQEPLVYAGLAYADVSRLTLTAGYRQIDVVFVITLCASLVVTLVISIFSRAATRPLIRLAQSVQKIQETGELEEIRLGYRGHEIATLENAINRLLETVKTQLKEIRRKDLVIQSTAMQQPAWMPEDTASGPSPGGPLDRLVGIGPKMDTLRREILKAAHVDVDVLILGETGTGKQLAAEAIHLLSHRCHGPFIAINCGALDENLLLDSLFGHRRGAFTEAKIDRKGAFLEADGGTLFLDEIQAASPRVQQSMLRAIAMRKIKPLGSDREIGVDVRLIAASNADLKVLIDKNRFREDLYFRLKVLTIHTPPLRELRENIPILAKQFLQEEAQLRGHPTLGLSRGALEKMKRYDWPGNIRELKNCMIRTAVMCENQLIQAEDLHIEVAPGFLESDPGGPGRPQEPLAPAGKNAGPDPPSPTPAPPATGLNARQAAVLAVIRQKGEVTRSQYQQIVGDGLPSRTAVYDLKDLVDKGLLKKVGRGPATRYVWRDDALSAPGRPDAA